MEYYDGYPSLEFGVRQMRPYGNFYKNLCIFQQCGYQWSQHGVQYTADLVKRGGLVSLV